MKMLPSATVKTYTMFFSSSLFFQLWPIGFVGYSVFGLFYQVDLYDSFGQQFFYRAKACGKSLLPHVGKTEKTTYNIALYIYSLQLCG